MKGIHYMVAVFLFSANLSAQIKVPSDLQQRINGKDKLHEIMLQVDSFYATKPDTDNHSMREWKHWKRWEWEMSRYVNADGKLVNVKKNYSDALLQEEQKRQQQSLPELNESTAQWTYIGPDSAVDYTNDMLGIGRLNRVAFSPTNSNIMYVGSPNGGLWKSTNAGEAFTPLENYGPNLGVSGIVVSHDNNNTLYVLTGDGDGGGFITNFGYRSYSTGIMKSVDGGNNWVLQKNGLPPDTGWTGYTIVQSNTNANVLLVATKEGIYRTQDGGSNWSKVLDSITTDIKFRPGSGTTCYAAGYGWCNFSTDGGLTWTAAAFAVNATLEGGKRVQIGVTPANPNYVYLLAGPVTAWSEFKGIWLSTNGGQGYDLRTTTPNILGAETNGSGDTDQSWYDLALAVSSSNANIIFTGGLCVWKSTGAGINFTYSTTYFIENDITKYIHPDIHDLQVNPLTGHLWAATDGGLYKSTDNGTTWQNYSNGIGTAQGFHIAGFDASPGLLFLGSQDNGIKNTLFGSTGWRQVGGGDGFDVVVDYNDWNRSWWSSNRKIFRSTDFGATNLCVAPGQGCNSAGNDWFKNIAQHSTNPNTIFIGQKTIYKSTDGGDNYTEYTQVSGTWDIKTCPSNSNRIYAAGGTSYSSNVPGQLYRTDDGGNTWGIISNGNGFPGTYPKITCIGVNPSNSNQVWVTFGGTNGIPKVFYSADAGNNWLNMSAGIPNVPVNCIVVTSSNDVYIGTEIGVYYKQNGGAWTPFYNNLPKSPIADLLINNLAGKIRASAFGRGIWESPLYASCLANVSVTGTQTGNKLYEASTQVNSTAIVTGGAGTEIFFKGGNNVTLTPGFEARTGSEFKAYINGCGLGGIPDINGRMTSGIDYTIHRLPMGDSTKFPFGTIELNPAGNEVTYRIYKPGTYSLQITDDKGFIIQTLTGKQIVTGVHTFSFTKPAVEAGLSYLQLWYNKELVHYQEIH